MKVSNTLFALTFITSAVGGAGGVRGIEGHTVSYCFKSLVTRFVDALKEIRSHDNIVIYILLRY